MPDSWRHPDLCPRCGMFHVEVCPEDLLEQDQGEYSKVQPPRCAAGRHLIHPDRSGWEEPCPEQGTEFLWLRDIQSGMKLCQRHMYELADHIEAEG